MLNTLRPSMTSIKLMPTSGCSFTRLLYRIAIVLISNNAVVRPILVEDVIKNVPYISKAHTRRYPARGLVNDANDVNNLDTLYAFVLISVNITIVLKTLSALLKPLP